MNPRQLAQGVGIARIAFGIGFITGLGHALYITLYDYLGYSDAALMGDEVKRPQRTIPAAVFSGKPAPTSEMELEVSCCR